MKSSDIFPAFIVVLLIVVMGLFLIKNRIVQIKFSDGLSIGEYSSPFYFQKGDSVLVFGPESKERVIPNKKEWFMETTIPLDVFPILKDTVLNFDYGPSKNVLQHVRIGVVDSMFEKNVFQ